MKNRFSTALVCAAIISLAGCGHQAPAEPSRLPVSAAAYTGARPFSTDGFVRAVTTKPIAVYADSQQIICYGNVLEQRQYVATEFTGAVGANGQGFLLSANRSLSVAPSEDSNGTAFGVKLDDGTLGYVCNTDRDGIRVTGDKS